MEFCSSCGIGIPETCRAYYVNGMPFCPHCYAERAADVSINNDCCGG